MHDVFGNTFSEDYAPQNLDIQSKLKTLHFLVSEIDVFLWKMPPFVFKMSSKMADTMTCIRQYFFLHGYVGNACQLNCLCRLLVEGRRPEGNLYLAKYNIIWYLQYSSFSLDGHH